jgi:hypothetical protein
LLHSQTRGDLCSTDALPLRPAAEQTSGLHLLLTAALRNIYDTASIFENIFHPDPI